MSRASDLRAFYTDDGVLPRAALAELEATLVRSCPSWSLHALGGGAAWQVALFVVAAACAIGLALGWRTRAMTIATWALLTSLQARMPLVLYRGDVVLRAMLFVAIWLPLGARFSLDARRRSGSADASPSQVSGAACFVAAAQLAIVYLVGVGHKSGPTWRDGTAVYYALQLDDYVTPAGRWLGARAAWSLALTYGTLVIELAAPLLLFVPWRRDVLRIVAVAAAFALHAGMLVTMRLALFPWIMFACWALFLPPRFWDACGVRGGPARGSASEDGRGRAHDRRWAPVLGAALCAIVGWNAGELAEPPSPSPALGAVLRPLGLVQRWSMFSPDPRRDDGFLVAMERRAEGASKRPLLYDDLRWRMYLALVARDASGRLTAGLLAWLCRRDPSAEELSLVFKGEYTMPPGEPPYRDDRFLDGATCETTTLTR
ncbi:MAG: HTTM domain-containing protein [Labilithrix sp.]|nr:HTTM domain-containing protein [Labilithrix sp.]MCW5812254.1 HTTM domain-containing protein [Labilithrix sp.]